MPLTLRHVDPPYKGDCIWGGQESIRLGYAAQDFNGVCLADLVFAAAHGAVVSTGYLDSPYTGVKSGTRLDHMTSAQWKALGPPKDGGPQRPALLRDIIAWSAGKHFTVCCDIKPGAGTHQVAPYADLKTAGVAHGAPFLVMTEQWSKTVCPTRAKKSAWEASAKLRFAAAKKADVPTMLLWRENIPAHSDWWPLLDAVKGAPGSQKMPAHVVRVPNSSTAATARKVLAKVTGLVDWGTAPKPAPPKPPEVPVRPAAPSPPYVGPAAHTSSGSNQPIQRIVLHSTVSPCKPGGARATATYFRSPRSGGSAHYIVDPNEVVQCVWDDTIAWHAPPNRNSLGIEMCDMPDQNVHRWDDAAHRATYARVVALTAGLCAAYGVPVVKLNASGLKSGHKGICGHADVSAAWHQTDHWDPGAFPWDRFIADVKATMAGKPPAPTPAKPPASHKPASTARGTELDIAIAALGKVTRRDALATAKQAHDLLLTIKPL